MTELTLLLNFTSSVDSCFPLTFKGCFSFGFCLHFFTYRIPINLPIAYGSSDFIFILKGFLNLFLRFPLDTKGWFFPHKRIFLGTGLDFCFAQEVIFHCDMLSSISFRIIVSNNSSIIAGKFSRINFSIPRHAYSFCEYA